MNVFNAVWGDGKATHLYTINRDTSHAITFEYPATTYGFRLTPFSQDITLNAGNNTIRVAANTGVAELQYIELQYVGGGGSNQVAVTGVTLDKGTLSLAAGSTETLAATVAQRMQPTRM